MDFDLRGDDVIWLKAAAFGNLAPGPLAGSAFQTGPGAAARTDAVRLIHDTATGKLWFDLDGTGAQAAVLLAQMPVQAAIGAEDFFLF